MLGFEGRDLALLLKVKQQSRLQHFHADLTEMKANCFEMRVEAGSAAVVSHSQRQRVEAVLGAVTPADPALQDRAPQAGQRKRSRGSRESKCTPRGAEGLALLRPPG